MKGAVNMHLSNEIHLDFPAIPENEALARLVVSAFLLPLNPTLEELADVKTAVSEAVTNAIVHGYAHRSGSVRMRARCSGEGQVCIEVRDQGCGIADVNRARQPFFTTLESEERSGMGFTVMESFMDQVEVESAPGRGTAVRLYKQLNQREERLAQRA